MPQRLTRLPIRQLFSSWGYPQLQAGVLEAYSVSGLERSAIGRAGTLSVSGSYSASAITIKLFYDFGRVDTYSGTFEDDAHRKGIVAHAQGTYSYPLTFIRQ